MAPVHPPGYKNRPPDKQRSKGRTKASVKLTPKQLRLAGKVLDERFDVRSLLVQSFHMAGAIQRILWRLNMPAEPLTSSYLKFAEAFKDEVQERWALEGALTTYEHQNGQRSRATPGMGINRGPGQPSHRGDPNDRDADHLLRSRRPMTTELTILEKRIEER